MRVDLMKIDVNLRRLNNMDKIIRIYMLAIKYYFKGDDWKFAKEFATTIVKGFKKL